MKCICNDKEHFQFIEERAKTFVRNFFYQILIQKKTSKFKLIFEILKLFTFSSPCCCVNRCDGKKDKGVSFLWVEFIIFLM